MVGVVSQGKSDEDARRCLQVAVELWFESCLERGVLDQALREANFRTPGANRPAVRRTHSKKAKTDILGEAFEIHLTIPAYEATPLLGATA